MRVFIISLFLFLSGCSSLSEDETLSWSAPKLYSEAKSSMESSNFSTARNYYGKLLARYPFGRFAQQADLDLIWLEYRDQEYEAASKQADKFIRLYPNSAHVDYAYYMKGIVSYSRDISIVDRIIPTNIAQSDPALIQQAFDEFEQLVQRSPNGKYSTDAQARMLYLRNILAEHEVHVARFYLQKKAYLAAVNRAQYVLENYASTPSVPYALAIMTRAYQEMKLPVLAADTRRVLDQNFADLQNQKDIERLLNGDIHSRDSFLDKIGDTLKTN